MKSHVLIGAGPRDVIEAALDDLLPGQRHPWLMLSSLEDPIAYFHVEPDGEAHADMSGRHHNDDGPVLAVLDALRARVGGTILEDSSAKSY